MRRPISLRRWPAGMSPVFLFLCLLSPAAHGQTDPKQAMCQAAWDRCMASGGGKNWKPIYDRCLKARTTCLGGRAYVPDVPQYTASSSVPLTQAAESDAANADPTTGATLCENGEARGARNSCVL